MVLAVQKFERSFANFGAVFRVILTGLAIFLILWGLKQAAVLLFPKLNKTPVRHMNRHQIGVPREGGVYLLIMGVLFVGSLLGRSNMLMLVFSMMAGPFILNGWVTFVLLRQMAVKRKLPTRCMADETVSVEIELGSQKQWMSTWLMTVNDRIISEREELQSAVLFSRVPPKESRSAYYQMQLGSRGRYQLGPLELTTRFPLGLVERGLVFDESGEIIVHPRTGQLTANWKRDLFQATELVHQAKSRPGTYDDEFHRLREYREGDNPTAIHWRTSARRNELMVREFQQTRDQSLILVLDLFLPPHPTPDDRERVELAISFAATICLEQLCGGHDTDLKVVTNGVSVESWESQSGGASLESLLDVLALVKAGAAEEVAEMYTMATAGRVSQSHMILVTTRRAEVGQFRGLGDQAAHQEVMKSGIPMTLLEASATQLSSLFVLS